MRWWNLNIHAISEFLCAYCLIWNEILIIDNLHKKGWVDVIYFSLPLGSKSVVLDVTVKIFSELIDTTF
jgi:hypothetical protein